MHAKHAPTMLALATVIGLAGATLAGAAARAPDRIELRLSEADAPPPALGSAVPVTASATDAATAEPRLGPGGCGERAIRVYDAAVGAVRERTAHVCWRTLL